VWTSQFEDELAGWNPLFTNWGGYNRSYSAIVGVPGKVLNVFVPSGSIDPGTMRARGLPYGGTGIQARPFGNGATTVRLSYLVRLPADFMPGRGGKLPGLCGGTCNGGGHIPNGTDGFSARLMWDRDGNANAYVYLPTSSVHGTHLGRGAVPLAKGGWTRIVQELTLNTVGHADGTLRIWANGQLYIDEVGLLYRNTNDLQIDGIYFDVFYGGSDDTWAAPQDTTIQFADFAVLVR
jgi:hypothetical protein